MKNARAHLFITGDVTGVGFRYWAVREANKLKIYGWARNMDAGLVEIVAEGKKESIMAMIEICKRGPETSLVKEVEVKWEEAENELNGFEIRY